MAQFFSEFYSSEDSSISNMEKTKNNGIITTLYPDKRNNATDVSKLTDNELMQKILDLIYDDQHTIIESRNSHGSKIKELEEYNGSEVEKQKGKNHARKTSSITIKPTFENHFTVAKSHNISNIDKEVVPASYKSKFVSSSLQEHVKYFNPLEQLTSSKWDYTGSDNQSRIEEKPFKRTGISQISGSVLIHKNGSDDNIVCHPVKTGKKSLFIIFIILTILTVAIRFIYHRYESIIPYDVLALTDIVAATNNLPLSDNLDMVDKE